MNTEKTKSTAKWPLLILVLLNYFTFMLITNIIGVLLVNWKEDFQLSPAIMTLLGAVFFIAYGLTSLPQGILSERIGSKKTFIWASGLILIGSLAFALFPSFNVGLVSLFIIGTGVTALQIVGNLLVKRIDEDPEKYSRNLTMAQVFCGIGAMSGGFLNSALSQNVANFHWTAFYFIFAILIGILGFLAFITPIPASKAEKKAKPEAGDYLKLASNPLMLLFAFGIFVYVGVEVGIANWIKEFLATTHIATFSNAETNGAAAKQALYSYGDKIFGLFWLLQSVGRFTGGLVLNFLKTAKALIVYALGALISLLIAIYTPSVTVAGIAFVAVGFFTSIMFPSIFSLAVNTFSEQEDTVAGILCTAIIGGAITQVAIGALASQTGLTTSLAIISTISFLYIAFIGVKSLNNTPETAKEELQTA